MRRRAPHRREQRPVGRARHVAGAQAPQQGHDGEQLGGEDLVADGLLGAHPVGEDLAVGLDGQRGDGVALPPWAPRELGQGQLAAVNNAFGFGGVNVALTFTSA